MEPGHSYVFRVRATDRMQNVSSYVVSSPLEAVSRSGGTPPPGTAPPPPAAGTSLPSPGLHVKSTKRTASRLIVSGTLARAATAQLTVLFTTKVGRKTYRLRAHATPKRGRFTATVRLLAAARRARHGTLRITYPGGNGFRSQAVRTSVASG